MKAIQIRENGGPEVLRLQELKAAEPSEGQAQVRIESSGINYLDVYQRTDRIPTDLPFIPGNEGAGVVTAIGGGVTEVRVGDRVAYAGVLGSYAEYATVPAWRLVQIPEWLDFSLAAAVILQGLTAHYLVHSAYPLKAGDTCLIHAAAGGTGLLLTQVAKRLGARVIGTTSTEEKADAARSAGCDDVILYTQQDFESEVKRLTGGQGVQVVYDGVGKTTFDKGLNCLAPRGYMVIYGQASGRVPPVDVLTLMMRGSLFLTRPTLANYTASQEELVGRAKDIFNWVASRELKVRIDTEFPLEQAAEAHRRLEARESIGKIILRS